MNRRLAANLFEDLFLWLAGRPLAAVEPWPEKHRAAVLVQGDIEDQFEKVNSTVELFDRLGIPVTYNLLVDEASRRPDLVKKMLAADGELAIHGDNHNLFAGQPFHIQHLRLSEAIDYIVKQSSYPAGFRPPELVFDAVTIEVMQNLGLSYLLADSTADRAYPRFQPHDPDYPEAGGITFFPKCELDDYDDCVPIFV